MKKITLTLGLFASVAFVVACGERNDELVKITSAEYLKNLISQYGFPLPRAAEMFSLIKDSEVLGAYNGVINNNSGDDQHGSDDHVIVLTNHKPLETLNNNLIVPRNGSAPVNVGYGKDYYIDPEIKTALTLTTQITSVGIPTDQYQRWGLDKNSLKGANFIIFLQQGTSKSQPVKFVQLMRIIQNDIGKIYFVGNDSQVNYDK